MNKQISLFLKNDDSMKARKSENEDGQYLSIDLDDLTIYFDGYGEEGYRSACDYLNRMKHAIIKAWKGE